MHCRSNAAPEHWGQSTSLESTPSRGPSWLVHLRPGPSRCKKATTGARSAVLTAPTRPRPKLMGRAASAPSKRRSPWQLLSQHWCARDPKGRAPHQYRESNRQGPPPLPIPPRWRAHTPEGAVQHQRTRARETKRRSDSTDAPETQTNGPGCISTVKTGLSTRALGAVVAPPHPPQWGVHTPEGAVEHQSPGDSQPTRNPLHREVQAGLST